MHKYNSKHKNINNLFARNILKGLIKCPFFRQKMIYIQANFIYQTPIYNTLQAFINIF